MIMLLMILFDLVSSSEYFVLLMGRVERCLVSV